MCCRTFTMFNDCVAKLLEERSNFSVTEVGAPVIECIYNRWRSSDVSLDFG